tara:strand:+ start:839 stop:1288 length:450 start_codon:yes stop_codon:yes gene_type:complete
MIKVAMVKDNGEIQTIVCPSVDSLYEDGQDCGEVTARILPFETDTMNALELTYWHNDAWATRTARPSHLSVWEGHDTGWVTPVEPLGSVIRDKRGILLINSDWTQVPDTPLADAKKAEWAEYRQALRDLPQDYLSATSLDDITWPTKPE